MIDSVKNFLFEYFWLPIIDQSVHYNVYNTTVYAILFAVTAIYLVFPLVKKIGLDFDKDFFIALTPFVFLGGFARSLRDLGILDTFLLETPIIYILIFNLVILILVLTRFLERKNFIKNYWTFTTFLGCILVFATLFLFLSNSELNLGPLLHFTALLTMSSVLFLTSLYLFSRDLLNLEFVLPVIAHFADSSSTVAALNRGAEEKHVLANLFIDVFGLYGMFIMKALVIIPVSYYIVKEFEAEKRNYYLFLVAFLGIALATRNMTSITFSV